MTIFKSRFADVPLCDQSITERVFSGMDDRLDDVVLVDSVTGHSLTARAFVDRVKRLAGGLTAAGFGAGRTIAIMAPNMPEYCVIFHAAAWAGGTVTSLNPTYKPNEIAHQVADAKADVLVTVAEFEAKAREGAGNLPVLVIGSPEYDALLGEPLAQQVEVDLDTHTVVLPYSSGTTGLPKGVMLSHRNLVVNLDQFYVGTPLQKGEMAIAFLPFFHIYGINVLMNAHLARGGLVTMPRFDLEAFLKNSQDHKARRMWTVPPVALALAKHPIVDDFDLSSVEHVIIGAAPSGPELSHAISKRLNCVTTQGYGMTELSPVSHVTPVALARDGSSGLVAPNTMCRIVGVDSGENLPAGEEGELWVKGPQVMQGYLNNPKATAESIVEDGWMRTGDIAVIDEDGYLFVVDRLKELIKFKGFQVAPAELEAALVAMDGIKDAAVIGLPDDEAGEVPIAFIMCDDNAPSDEDIHAHFQANLSSYKQLHQIHRVDALPKTPSGKILRRVLRDQVAAA